MAGGMVCWREVSGVRFMQVEKWEGTLRAMGESQPMAAESMGQSGGSATIGGALVSSQSGHLFVY